MKPILTPTEQEYLALLLETPDGVETDVFLECSPDAKSGPLLVAQNMKNLRRKVGDEYDIQSIRGWGYRLIRKV